MIVTKCGPQPSSTSLITAEDLWWREYIPLLHVVPTTGLPMTLAADKIAHEDLSEIGAAQLTGLIGPVGLLAEDRDLVRHGIAAQDWRKVEAGQGKLGAPRARSGSASRSLCTRSSPAGGSSAAATCRSADLPRCTLR